MSLYDSEEEDPPGFQRIDAKHTGQWQQLAISWDFGETRDRDYFAVSLHRARTGDYIDVREASVVIANLPNQRTLLQPMAAAQEKP